MRKNLKTMMLAALGGVTALTSLPPEALAGPMSVAPPSTLALGAPVTAVHYYRRWGYHRYGYWRPYHRHWGYYRPYRRWGYYRPYYRRVYYGYPAYSYGYDPGGAIFAGAALGLMGAGLAAATAPRWGWGGGWGPGWGWGGGWGPGWGGGWW